MTPTQICGYCGSHYAASTCICPQFKAVGEARVIALARAYRAAQMGITPPTKPLVSWATPWRKL